MDFDYTESQKSLRNEITEHFRATSGGDGLRLQGLAIPEKFGGRGLSPPDTIAALEAFGHACEDPGLLLSVCAQLLANAVPINESGTGQQKSEWLPGLCDGSKIGVNTTGDPESSKLTAAPEGDGFTLSGAQPIVINGPDGDLGIFAATTEPDKGLTAFLVDLNQAGVTRSAAQELLGDSSLPVCELAFEDARASVLGKVGNGLEVLNQAANWVRVGLHAAHVGTMERLTESAIKQARAVKQSGAAENQIEANASKVVDMKLRLETSRLLTFKAASQLPSGREVGLDASVANLFVNESLVESARDHLELHASSNLSEAGAAASALTDALASTLGSGTASAQRKHIATQLGL